ncbi:MAG: hypothetical protein AAGB93_22775 [Planctomycetota bacterium]
MQRRDFLGLAASCGLAGAWHPSTPAGEKDVERAMRILAAARSFGTGGGYDRTWGGTGVPIEITHDGRRVLSKSERGTYCCGFTFAAAMRALEGTRALSRLDSADARAFQKAWYGATEVAAERQCAHAVERFRLGREVDLDDAMAGDFVQLWRRSKKPSGHSVLLLGWVEAGGERLGLTYLSSQGSTNGIGVAFEAFAESGIEGGRVDPERTYAARLSV